MFMPFGQSQPANPTVGRGTKNDPPLAPVGPYHFGQGGLFHTLGTDMKIVSALMLPVSGLMSVLPVYNGGDASGNMFGGEMIDATNILTGITSGDADLWANQPTEDCGTGPVGGLKKLCTVVNTYGRIRGSCREISMYRAGQRTNYAEQPWNLQNEPAVDFGQWWPSLAGNLRQALATDIQERIYETMVSLYRMFNPRVYIGTPANNVGEAKDIWGLDSQINVNTHRDRDGSHLCTAADADVKDFGYSLITGGTRNFVEYVEMCDTYVMWNALRMGLMPYDYWVVMHPNAWPTVSEIWPVRQYQKFIAQMAVINAQGGNAAGNMMMNVSDAYGLRQQFRDQLLLPINGRAHQVILDDGITEQSPDQNANLLPGQWASTVYGVPRTFLGGIPATFWKYFNHDNAQARAIDQFVGRQMGNGPTWTSDGGLFRWYSDFKDGCLKLKFEFGPSLHCVTSQLAWRIDNVAYSPLQHLRSADPASSYFKDGGRTSDGYDTVYTGWNGATPVTLS